MEIKTMETKEIAELIAPALQTIINGEVEKSRDSHIEDFFNDNIEEVVRRMKDLFPDVVKALQEGNNAELSPEAINKWLEEHEDFDIDETIPYSVKEKIDWGTFNTKEGFKSYYIQHYKPLLEKADTGNVLSMNDVRLLRFLAQDLNQLFGVENK